MSSYYDRLADILGDDFARYQEEVDALPLTADEQEAYDDGSIYDE